MEIKNGKLIVYDVKEDYRNYLRKFDEKVSLKFNRRFYGILVTENNIDYCIPFTCRVKRRNEKITIDIKHKNKIIAQLLINNMIPVSDKVINIVDVNNDKQKEFLNDEIIYLRNKQIINEILCKTSNVLKILKNKNHFDYEFFKNICCDYETLEKIYKEY